jgi:hypothetical protein
MQILKQNSVLQRNLKCRIAAEYTLQPVIVKNTFTARSKQFAMMMMLLLSFALSQLPTRSILTYSVSWSNEYCCDLHVRRVKELKRETILAFPSGEIEFHRNGNNYRLWDRKRNWRREAKVSSIRIFCSIPTQFESQHTCIVRGPEKIFPSLALLSDVGYLKLQKENEFRYKAKLSLLRLSCLPFIVATKGSSLMCHVSKRRNTYIRM